MNFEQSPDSTTGENVTEVIIVRDEAPAARRRNPVGRFICRWPIVFTGLLAAALVFGFAYIVSLIIFTGTFGFGIPPVLSIALLVVYILGFVLAALAPALYLGITQGWKKGIGALIATLAWLVIVYAIYYLLNPTPSVQSMMYGGY
jgi:hypothetical protein